MFNDGGSGLKLNQKTNVAHFLWVKNLCKILVTEALLSEFRLPQAGMPGALLVFQVPDHLLPLPILDLIGIDK